MASNTITGARAVFKINGNKVAYATNCSYTVDHEHLPVNVLDQLEVVEYSESAYFVTFSAARFRIAGHSVLTDGIMPKLQDILTQPLLTAELIDRTSNVTLMKIEGVKPVRRSGSIASRALGTEGIDFVGIRATDESNVLGSSTVEATVNLDQA